VVVTGPPASLIVRKATGFDKHPRRNPMVPSREHGLLTSSTARSPVDRRGRAPDQVRGRVRGLLPRNPKPPILRRTSGIQARPPAAWARMTTTRRRPGTDSARLGTAHRNAPRPPRLAAARPISPKSTVPAPVSPVGTLKCSSIVGGSAGGSSLSGGVTGAGVPVGVGVCSGLGTGEAVGSGVGVGVGGVTGPGWSVVSG
jgi:hypothetical protein